MSEDFMIGLTYDLREEHTPYEGAPLDYYGEFDSEENIDHLEQAITSLGYAVCRIGNLRDLVQFLAAERRVDLVFNMAEGLWGRSREGQVPSLLEAYRIPYTGSDPLAASLTLDKAFAKRLWLHDGIATAPFAVISDVRQCEAAVDRIGDYPLFIKPLQEGSSKGIDSRSIVHSLEQLREQTVRLLVEYRQPVLAESYLSGREFTVGILGSGETARTIGAIEVNTEAVNSFVVKEGWELRNENYYTPVETPELLAQLSELALRAYRCLECQDIGRVDIRLDEQGQPYVMEINPIPALHPTHSAMPTIGKYFGLPYATLLAEIIHHARQRWAV